MNNKILETLIGLRDNINNVIGMINYERDTPDISFDSKIRLFEEYVKNTDKGFKFTALDTSLHWHVNKMRKFGLRTLLVERYGRYIEIQMHAPKNVDGRCIDFITIYTILPAIDERTNSLLDACKRMTKTNSDYMLIEYMWGNFPTFETRCREISTLCKYIDEKF